MKHLVLISSILNFVSVAAVGSAATAPASTAANAGAGAVATNGASAFDTSLPLAEMGGQFIPGRQIVIHPAVESKPDQHGPMVGPGEGLGSTPPTVQAPRGNRRTPPPIVFNPPPPAPTLPAAAIAVQQTAQGTRPAIVPGASFDGMGEGFTGRVFPGSDAAPAPGESRGGANHGSIDISLAVGPDHIIEILSGNLAVFTKKGKKYKETGKLLYGPITNDTVFAGFGARCGVNNNADSVVRYDQLADRWLIVVPVFAPPETPGQPYAMCYAVSATSDPLGKYYRYEFQRPLFPDYPRPAIWPDGYYLPSSTSDNLLPDIITQKHECIADRNKMLKGEPATEQCVIMEGGVFVMNTDVDGKKLPPPGAPNIMLSTGGTQLMKIADDDGIYFYKVHVDWSDPSKTTVTPPQKIPVAPYHYLCDGQLSDCVSQPGTQRRLDSQGDKLMQRLTYRNFGDHESIVAEHSVAAVGPGGQAGGGVRWYEFRLDKDRNPVLYQQSTYAPEGNYRWLASMAMDHKGDIGVGYSFGGDPNYPGQRFAARLAKDPKGQLTFHESVLAEGQASQIPSLRWEDYTTTVIDPSDDCTFWTIGNYLKSGATSSTTRIGSFKIPGCK